MSNAGNGKKVFFIFYLAAIHLLVGFLIYDKFSPVFPAEKSELNQVVPLPSPVQIPFEANNLPNNAVVSNESQANSANAVANVNANISTNQTADAPTIIVPASSDKLMIPVAGIKRENLSDTFTDARSENRVHNAIDIMAPQGAPVVAVAEGEIVKFFDSNLGGITIYQLSKDRKYIYYYAHLQKRADGLQEKVSVPQGTVIGYVGDTGNAGAGNFHLHFSISVPTDPSRYWEGENVNPFPLLKDGIEARAR